MSLIENIKNKFKARVDDMPVVEENGEVLYGDDIVGDVLKKLEERRDKKRWLELQWQLNANFLVGNQNCDINIAADSITQTDPSLDTDTFEVYNRIAPLMETRQALLSDLQYRMRVNPRTDEIDDEEKAEVSTKILQYIQTSTDFNKQMDNAISWTELTGTAFIISGWDKGKGEQIGEVVATDGENSDVEAVYEGDLSYGLLSPYKVFPNNIYKESVKDQYDIIIEQIMSVDEIYDVYGFPVEGESVDTYMMIPVEGSSSYGQWSSVTAIGRTTLDDSAKVVTQFYRPSRKYPKGKLIIVIQNHLFYYGDLPYREIPIVAIKSKSVQGQFFGRSVIEDLIPWQRAYNNIQNKMQDILGRISAGAVLIPEGAVEDMETLEQSGVAPGQVIIYNPERGKPSPYNNTDAIPNSLWTEFETVERAMEYVAGVSQLSVIGDTPAGVTSGAAIDKLKSIDNTRISLTGDSLREGVLSLAKIWLSIYKDFAKGYRISKIAGDNDSGLVVTWCAEDINSFDVIFTTENELKVSSLQQREAFISAYRMGLFNSADGTVPPEVKQKALEAFNTGRFSEIPTLNRLQEKNAQNENAKFNYGTIPQVDRYDNHDIHIREHLRYALQAKFKDMRKNNPNYAAAFDAHIAEHSARLQQKRQAAQQMIKESQNETK